MYQISLTNNSNVGIGFVGGNQVIPPGQGWKSGNLGDITLSVPTRGPLSFHDIADKHIGGDSKETWGVLIAYQGEECVGRYEGGGQLAIQINQYYQAVVTGMDIRQLALPGMLIGGEPAVAATENGDEPASD
jgi:hypothetical protein